MVNSPVCLVMNCDGPFGNTRRFFRRSRDAIALCRIFFLAVLATLDFAVSSSRSANDRGLAKPVWCRLADRETGSNVQCRRCVSCLFFRILYMSFYKFHIAIILCLNFSFYISVLSLSKDNTRVYFARALERMTIIALVCDSFAAIYY